ncbi:putative rRNA maturation protein (Nop14) [Penicillium brasilianum]|uniref:Putative rRNA maturation protein (Nop14) n=1 Tax=Penicillium brasilianum TaxID=104259 RepID=A0A1S9RGG4_PENBI|nr:putative rRNA maturation protein (Nop14) [Penicillium brasilianum]
MPPSQLKQLKASLRESGVVGPQQSKKQKRQNAKSGVAAQNRNQRNASLQAIRDRFNPFEIRPTATRSKFEATTRDDNSKKATGRRPGVTKSLGEERRRATLLQEMNSRNKVGGLVDRRFGENDPTMTPEERAAERFARESQKKMRKESMFNLEEDEEEFQLTHMGQSLTLDGTTVDDFDARDLGGDLDGDLDGAESDEEASRKRKRFGEDEEDAEDFIDFGEDGEYQPERKKSKAEVMKEVIAKSKFHKAERQKAKDDDDDLREELDQELPDLFEALRGMKAPAKPEPPKQDLDTMNPERAAMLLEPEGKNTEKEYDQRLKQLTFDQRSKPTDRTKTEEEKVEEEAKRLKKLEEDRLRRMRGEQVSDEEDAESDKDSFFQGDEDEEESEVDDAAAFGLHTTSYEPRPELAVEDEDDFVIDDDLVETRSNASLSLDQSDIEEEQISSEDEAEESEEEDELINGMTLPTASSAAATTAVQVNQTADGKLAFTYPCPGNHEEFLEITKDVPTEDLPTVIQRIRALHHPRLHASNKAKLGRFAEILVEHVSYMGNETEEPSFAIIENILRHVHSLAKTHPINVAMAFRARLREISEDRPLSLLPGDLVVLTGISTVFPTSDHFHAVATPAHLCIARFLGQCSLNTTSDFVTGAFATSLCLQYQAIAKRYMPEFINYILNALCNLAPTELTAKKLSFPFRKSQQSVQLAPSKKVTPRKLHFRDIQATPSDSQAEEDLKISLVTTFVSLLDTASDLWAEKSAFIEIFNPVRTVLSHLRQSFKNKVFAAARDPLQSTLDKIDAHLARAQLARRPLLLHNHRPLAIKSAIPKFEENFNPDKHYDPDRERAEANRLKAEYKREKKGAMRELRKDASFVAREKLREKKERDAEYEKKYKKLIAEIQSEEGRAANEYEREKRGRQGKR